MRCPKCNTQNNYYHIYCYYCGTKLIQNNNNDVIKNTNDIDDNDTNDIDDNNMPDDSTDDRNMHNQQDNHMNSFEDNQNNEYDSDTYDNYVYTKRSGSKSGKSSKKPLIAIGIILGILVLAAYVYHYLNRDLNNTNNKSTSNQSSITASFTVKPDIINNKPVHVLNIQSPNGETIKILDQTIPIKNGNAKVIIENDKLTNFIDKNNGQDTKVLLDVVISKNGCADKKAKLSFTLVTPAAPFEILQPSSKQATVEGSTYNIIMKVNPGSNVYINNNNYTDMVDQTGKLNVKVNVPDSSENIYKVKVNSTGFKENIQKIVLNRPGIDIPLTINEKIPIKSSGKWVKITGNTLPQAKLYIDRDTKFTPDVDSTTGDFVIYAAADMIGYTPCILKASLDGKKDTIVNIILETISDESEYTKKAWALEYEKLKSNEELENGRIFVFSGKVTKIIMQGEKNIFLIDVGTSEDAPQPVYVEYYGSKSLQKDQKIKVFANRWGNNDGIPRMLAKYIYNK